MGFEEWYKRKTPWQQLEYEEVWNAAQADMKERCAKLVDAMQDEQEPWMDGNDIRAIDKEK